MGVGRPTVVVAAVALVAVAGPTGSVLGSLASPGTSVSGEVGAVGVEIDVSPEPLRPGGSATLHLRVAHGGSLVDRHVVVAPVWPDGWSFHRVAFDGSVWRLQCSDPECRSGQQLAVELGPGERATANVTVRVPPGAGGSHLLGLRTDTRTHPTLLLAKQVPVESPRNSPTPWPLPDLSALETVAGIAVGAVTVAKFAFYLRDRRRGGP